MFYFTIPALFLMFTNFKKQKGLYNFFFLFKMDGVQSSSQNQEQTLGREVIVRSSARNVLWWMLKMVNLWIELHRTLQCLHMSNPFSKEQKTKQDCIVSYIFMNKGFSYNIYLVCILSQSSSWIKPPNRNCCTILFKCERKEIGKS